MKFLLRTKALNSGILYFYTFALHDNLFQVTVHIVFLLVLDELGLPLMTRQARYYFGY